MARRKVRRPVRGPQALAAFHIDDVAVFGEPVDEGGGQVVVFEEGTPFGKAQVGGDEGGLFLVALVHEGEEESHLHRFDLDVANLIDEQDIKGEVFFEDPVCGMVGDGGVEFVDQVRQRARSGRGSPGRWRERGSWWPARSCRSR